MWRGKHGFASPVNVSQPAINGLIARQQAADLTPQFWTGGDPAAKTPNRGFCAHNPIKI
jgi:hypothetical protein